MLFTIRKRMSEGHKLCASIWLSPHIMRSTFGSQHGEARTTGQERGFLSAVADVSGSRFILVHSTINIDELKAARDTLEAVGRRAERAKGAVARAPSLSISVSVGKVSSYLPPCLSSEHQPLGCALSQFVPSKPHLLALQSVAFQRVRHSTFLGKVLCGDGRILIQLFCHSSSSFSSDHHQSSTIPSTSIYLFVRVRRAHQTHYRDTRYPASHLSSQSSAAIRFVLAARCVLCHNICLESSLVQVPGLCVHCDTVRHGAIGTGIPSTRTPNTSTADIAGEKLGSQLISRVGASSKPSTEPEQTDKAFNSVKARTVQTILRA